MSSVEYIRKLPYVNKKAIGLQGHSFGAYETNYLITRTDLFAAAASACGMSDFISLSGSLRMDVYDNHDDVVYGQNRMGASCMAEPNSLH